MADTNSIPDLSRRGSPGSYQRTAEDSQYQVNDGSGTNYNNPGAAEYGGQLGGAEYYSNIAKGHMNDNSGILGSNTAALNASLANMRGPGPHSADENTALVGRDASARHDQNISLNLLGRAAAGYAPSEAQFRTDQGMNNLMGARATGIGSARGLAGLTGAQIGGSQTIGGSANDMAANGAFGRSKEINEAMATYGAGAGAMRGADINRIAQNNQYNMNQATNNDQWRLGNANLAAAQGGLNNSLNANNLDWYRESQKPLETQFANDQAAQGWEAGAGTDADAIRREIANENASNVQRAQEGFTDTTVGAMKNFFSGMGGKKG